MSAVVVDFEEFAASRRPPRSIGECTVRDGLVCCQLPARMTPEQARAWSAHLAMLADSAEAEREEAGENG
jgi:hypothetical protein